MGIRDRLTHMHEGGRYEAVGPYEKPVARHVGLDEQPLLGRISVDASTSKSKYTSFDTAIGVAIVLWALDIFLKFNGFVLKQTIYFSRPGLLVGMLATNLIADALFIAIAIYALVVKSLENRLGLRDDAIMGIGFIILYFLYSAALKEFAGTGLTVYSPIEYLFVILYIAYLVMIKPDTRDAIATGALLFFIIILYHLQVIQPLVGFIHLIFGLLIYVLCLRRFFNDKATAKWALIILWIPDFFGPLLVEKFFTQTPLLRFTLPFWIIVTIIAALNKSPNGFNIIMFIFWMLYLIAYSIVRYSPTTNWTAVRDVMTNDERNEANDFINPVKIIQKVIEVWKEESARAVAMARGDYYTSQVDENAKKKLGVYLEFFDTGTAFYDNERIVIYATLTAQNFEVDEGEIDFKPIEITLSCEAQKDGETYVKGEVYPTDQFRIEYYDAENVECRFEPWELEKGGYSIIFKARFNFGTEAYLKTYFVSNELIDSLRKNRLIKEDIDVLTLNKITDINPVAKNSIAPVAIHANERIPTIIKLNRAYQNKFLFGVQLENLWEGKIEKIEKIEFSLPNNIQLEPGSCSPFPMEESGLTDDYQKFSLKSSTNQRLRDIKDNIEQNCWFFVPSSDIDKVLMPGDVTTRYFRISSRYFYILEKSLSILVSPPKGFNVKIVREDGKALDSSSFVRCEAVNENALKADVLFTLYEDGREIDSENKFCPDKSCSYVFRRKFERETHISCEAVAENTQDPENSRSSTAETIVKNSDPVITKVYFDKKQVNRGDTLECRVDVTDADDDEVIVQFDFSGLDIGSVQKECSGSCSVADIPIDIADDSSTIRCTAKAFDRFGGVSDEAYDTARVAST